MSGELLLAVAVALIPTLVLAAAHWTEAPAASTGDFAQYLLHAQALLDGRPYTDTGYLFQRAAQSIGPVAYPPGLPATLVPLLATGIEPILALRLLVVASLVVYVVLVVRYFAPREPLWLAVTTAGITGVAIESTRATVSMGSDLGFAALVMATLLLADRPGAYSWKRVAAVTVLGLMAMAYRFPGIALVPALGVQAFLRPGVERSRQLLVVALWVAIGLVVFTLVEPLRENLGSQVTRVLGTLEGIPRRIKYFGHVGAAPMMYPFASGVANDVYHAAGALLILIGAFHTIRRYAFSAIGVFAVIYGAMIVATPVVEARFYWPVFPLVALAMSTGAKEVACRVFARRPRVATRVVQVSLAVAAFLATLQSIRTEPLRPLLGDADMMSLLDWIERQPDRSSMRVVFFNPRFLSLTSGVPAMGVPSRPTMEIVNLAERTGITHFILGNPSNDVRESEGPLKVYMASRESGATLEFRNPTFAVYRLPPGS